MADRRRSRYKSRQATVIVSESLDIRCRCCDSQLATRPALVMSGIRDESRPQQLTMWPYGSRIVSKDKLTGTKEFEMLRHHGTWNRPILTRRGSDGDDSEAALSRWPTWSLIGDSSLFPVGHDAEGGFEKDLECDLHGAG